MPIGQIVEKALIEQHRILRDDADGGAQAILGDTPQVLTVDQDAPAGHVVEAEQQPCQRGLSGPAGACHGQLLPRFEREVQSLQDLPLWLVIKVHPLELHLATV